MGEAVRGFDWAATPLGALSTWPQSLRTVAMIVLENKLPAVLAWGPQLTCLYNDAYRPLLGDKPTPLGRPFREVWAEAQDIIDPIIKRALTGEASHYEGAAFVLMRNGRPEPAYFDYSFSPVRNDTASVAGFLNVAMETTSRVLAEKQQAFLAMLDRALQTLSEPSAVMMVAAGLLGRHLGVGRCGYGEVDTTGESFSVERDWTDGVMASMAGRVRIRDFGPELIESYNAGRSFVLLDVLEDPRTRDVAAAYAGVGQMRAGIGVPLVQGGRFNAAFYVHQTTPRQWTPGDETLVRAVAERVWAAVDRARAAAVLRRREAHWRNLFERLAEGFAVCTAVRDASGRMVDWRFVDVNPAWETIIGLTRTDIIGRTARAVIPYTESEWIGEFARAIDAGAFNSFPRPVCVATRWYEGRAVPLDPERFALLLFDTTERRHADERLRDSERRFRTLTEGLPVLLWRSFAGGNWTWSSPQWMAFTGQSQAASLGQGWTDMVHPDDRDAAGRAWDVAAVSGLLDVDHRVRRASDGEYVWHQARSAPVRDHDGRVVEWLGTTTDVQTLKELQERQGALVGELQHRTRNLIAIVRSLADKTVRGSGSLHEFQERFRDRLAALARVQTLLSRTGGIRKITFDELLRTELSAHAATEHEAGRVVLDGPDGVKLRSGTVQTLALALHELAANALRCGALAQPDAQLLVRWAIDPAGEDGRPQLRVEWRESGVQMPERTVPAADGYGRELIERALPYQIKASTTYELGADGVRCTITLPVSWTSVAEADHG